MSKVYVLHVSSDVNYEMPGVWENEQEAEAATVACIQSLRTSEGFLNDPEVPVVESFADVERWNDYWDTEADMQVHLHVVEFHPDAARAARLRGWSKATGKEVREALRSSLKMQPAEYVALVDSERISLLVEARIDPPKEVQG